MFYITNYDEEQLELCRRGLHDSNYANISDLDPAVHDANKMETVQHIRTNPKHFSSIEDLDFTQHCCLVLTNIAVNRKHGLEDLDKAFNAVKEARRTLSACLEEADDAETRTEEAMANYEKEIKLLSCDNFAAPSTIGTAKANLAAIKALHAKAIDCYHEDDDEDSKDDEVACDGQWDCECDACEKIREKNIFAESDYVHKEGSEDSKIVVHDEAAELSKAITALAASQKMQEDAAKSMAALSGFINKEQPSS